MEDPASRTWTSPWITRSVANSFADADPAVNSSTAPTIAPTTATPQIASRPLRRLERKVVELPPKPTEIVPRNYPLSSPRLAIHLGHSA